MTDWKLKLAAWLHDPAEKALILMRTKEGHEFGTAQTLREKLGIRYKEFDKRADHLAAAADRPQWPQPEDERSPSWARVRFTDRPELIHPLSGENIKLQPLAADIGPAEIKAVSVDHFANLIYENDAKKTFLAFWRFGPEAGRWAKDVGSLWSMTPAESRVPDHSIWSHVDTVSAVHTALADGDQPALFAMSFGPVQGFISQARSTSDLWAGSHLLSSIVWAALKEIVADLGPDAVLFPALRGVPAVDAWLLAELGDQGRKLFEDLGSEFINDKTDTNPLFAAALPNKFVCIIPSKRVKELAVKAIKAAKTRSLEIAHRAAQEVFEKAGMINSGEPLPEVTKEQITAQLAEFPETYWAAATWPLDLDDEGFPEMSALQQALTAFYSAETDSPGFFGDGLLKLLSEGEIVEKQGRRRRYKKLVLENGFEFFVPNSGMFYPAVYELAERSLAAAKAARPFDQLVQEGHRCTQCGEREWLTDEKTKLQSARGKRKPNGRAAGENEVETVWATLAANPKRRAWAKEGEHLCAVCAAKRLWPTLFAEEVGQIVGEKVDRFVVSTHALALSTSMDRLLDRYDTGVLEKLSKLSRDFDLTQDEPATLPKSLHARIRRVTQGENNAAFVLKRLPSALDRLRDSGDRSPMDRALKDLFGEDSKPETYYALIQMDGDKMGAWLAGNDDRYKLRYRDTWHSQVGAEVDKFAQRDQALKSYLETRRPPSPARHAAISRALNDFSIHLARHIVEDCVKGKLLYAGGDDVLALVAVDDLFDAMQLLRLAYSGIAPHENMGLDRVGELRAGGSGKQRDLLLGKGFALFQKRLMTLMGHKATASMGAVVAHHTAPLAMVLRQLREAENRAKNAGRDRFCIRVLKRGGGEVSVVSPWWDVPQDDEQHPMVERSGIALLKRMADELAATEFSRGAIYRAQLWFEGLTDNREDAKASSIWREQVTGTLAYQFGRQKGHPELAREVVDFVCDIIKPEHPLATLDEFLVTAEFFAREARAIAARGREKRKARNKLMEEANA